MNAVAMTIISPLNELAYLGFQASKPLFSNPISFQVQYSSQLGEGGILLRIDESLLNDILGSNFFFESV